MRQPLHPLLRFLAIPVVLGLVAGLSVARLRFSFPAVASIAILTAVLVPLLSAVIASARHRRLLRIAFQYHIESYRQVATLFRKRKGHHTWHFCVNCSTWPTSDYETSLDRPKNGELCNECKTRLAKGNCNS